MSLSTMSSKRNQRFPLYHIHVFLCTRAVWYLKFIDMQSIVVVIVLIFLAKSAEVHSTVNYRVSQSNIANIYNHTCT